MSRNRLSCGPFTRGTEVTLLQTLQEIGLRMADGIEQITCRPDATGGLRLEAQGEGVRGYDVTRLMGASVEAMQRTVEEKIALFSNG